MIWYVSPSPSSSAQGSDSVGTVPCVTSTVMFWQTGLLESRLKIDSRPVLRE